MGNQTICGDFACVQSEIWKLGKHEGMSAPTIYLTLREENMLLL